MTDHKPTGDLTDMHALLIRVDTNQGHLQKDTAELGKKLHAHITNYNALFVAVDRNSRAVGIAKWLIGGGGLLGSLAFGLFKLVT